MTPGERPDAGSTSAAQGSAAVIIPHLDDPRIADCVAAIMADPGPVESIIIVDNGSAASARAALDQIAGPVRIIDEPRPGSYAARNRGVLESQADVLLFTDADCIPRPGWATALASEAARSGCAGGPVHLASNHPPNRAERFDLLINGFRNTVDGTAKYAPTANLGVRRDVFDAVGPFRSDIYSGGDSAWGHRAAAAGWPVRFNSDAAIDHPARDDWVDVVRRKRRIDAGRVARSDRPRRMVAGWAFAAALPPMWAFRRARREQWPTCAALGFARDAWTMHIRRAATGMQALRGMEAERR